MDCCLICVCVEKYLDELKEIVLFFKEFLIL